MVSSSAESRPTLKSVKLRLPDGTRVSESEVWNTSLGGVFVAMSEPLAFGTELGMEFVFPRETYNIKCDGFVVWSTTNAPEKAPGLRGTAIRLVNIGIKEMRVLSEAVGRRLNG